MIDGNIGTVKNLKWTLEKKKSLNEGNGNIIFYNSGVKVEDKTKLNNYSKLFKRLDEINVWKSDKKVRKLSFSSENIGTIGIVKNRIQWW